MWPVSNIFSLAGWLTWSYIYICWSVDGHNFSKQPLVPLPAPSPTRTVDHHAPQADSASVAYDILDTPFVAAAGSEEVEDQAMTDEPDIIENSPVGAPATPPLTFTSSLVSPIGSPPKPCAVSRSGILEPQLPETGSSTAVVDMSMQWSSSVEAGKGAGMACDADEGPPLALLAVADLGQMAMLLGLGCRMSGNRPSSADVPSTQRGTVLRLRRHRGGAARPG